MTSGRTVCFPDCGCNCHVTDPEFDRIISEETNFDLRLTDILNQNIGWYTDRSLEDDLGLEGWPLKRRSGLYFLWQKDGYCANHQLFHMRCLYVGKGKFDARLRQHWLTKDTSKEMLVYFSFVELLNRQAKYVEQLLLDVYDLPYNNAENTGTRRLCGYFTQSEVD